MSIIKEFLKIKSFRVFLIAFFATFSLLASVAGINALTTNGEEVLASGDTSSNSIISGGVNSANHLKSKFNSLDSKGRAAFAHAGVNPNQCSGQIVLGATTRDNRVVVGNKTVATGAYTYGRGYINGSTQISGGAWMRTPSVSFRSSSIPSYVCMEGGEYKWAVINTCGNPVKAKATFKENPKLRIRKEASVKNVDYNQTFNYRINVRNIGNVVLKNVVVADVLPEGIEPVGLDAGAKYNKATRTIKWPAQASLGKDQRISKVLKVKVTHQAKPGNLKNIACVTTNYNQTLPICDAAYVVLDKKEEPKEEPFYSCDMLRVDKISQYKYKFTAEASAGNGAEIKMYTFDFDDGTENAVTDNNMVEHEYETDGNYNAKVYVTVENDGEEKTVTSENCEAPINIATPETPEAPQPKAEPIGKTLPDTGAGEVAGIFATISMAGAVAYRFVLARRFN